MNLILNCIISNLSKKETSHVIVKKILIKNLLNLRLLSFFIITFTTLLFFTPIIQARPTIGVLSVNVKYPSQGQEWLGVFLQKELSLQFQLMDRFSVISAETMSLWNERLKHSGQLDSSVVELKNTEIFNLKPDRILRLSVQKVLNKLSVNWEVSIFGESKSTLKIQKIHSWITPDKLIASLLGDLERVDKFFSHINHFPFNYTWEGIQSLYNWKLKTLPATQSTTWRKHKNDLENLLLRYPNLSSSIKYYRAILNIIESTDTLPAIIPSLNSAEKDIVDSMESCPGNGELHTLLSLIYFLRRETLFAKQQANIASKINQNNGLALILYGLTIGKTPKSGEKYIKRGLGLYPFIGEIVPNVWQPYNVLVKDLEPWLVSTYSEKTLGYEQLMISGKDFFNDRLWEKAQQSFEDAAALEPEFPEPLLYIARLELAQQKPDKALLMLENLRKKFPKNSDIILYLGYANERLKFNVNAEALYRKILLKNPENYKALLRLGSVLIKLGKREEARSFLESLTKKYPMYTVAWWNLGIVYFQLGEMRLAELAWEESLRLEPENNQVRVSLEHLREEIL